ncbi:MAG: 1,2-phenylacetyl-CoA epoxidase subunit PaaD [Cyclobacteriaceae bacterium]
MVAITEHKEIFDLLTKVCDPEIPVLSVTDMGIVRDVEVNGKHVVVTITPTYSGCPAMDTIATDIHNTLFQAGYQPEIKSVLSPAWSSDWITKQGRDKLEAYGIAPPLSATGDKKALLGEEKLVKCTNCGSQNTRMVSQFGSTACKALFQCNDCLEPFDYFKCI